MGRLFTAHSTGGASDLSTRSTRRPYFSPTTTRHTILLEEPCLASSPTKEENITTSTITPSSVHQQYVEPSELDFGNSVDATWD